MIRLSAVAAAFLMLTILTVARSKAAFTTTSQNTGSQWSTGTVALTDDDSGSAMFNVTGMTPGVPSTACLTVTYSGSIVPVNVVLYGSTTGSLATYIDTVIEVGSGGSFASCSGFSATSTLYSGTLANFSATRNSYANGVTAFAAAANPTSRTIRITTTLQNNNAAQGLSSTATFTFEVQA